jgi:uncharacterized protein
LLRSEHSIVTYEKGEAMPDRLGRARHGHYLDYARRMLAAYQAGTGLSRRELHRSVENILANEPGCDRRRIAAFCKLLDECGEFKKDARGAAAALRLRVFSFAAKYHPLVTRQERVFDRCEHEVKGLIAAEVGRPWPEIAAGLYADVIDFQPLKSFPGDQEPQALLSRYNVAQLQACLYRAQSMSVTASADFKTILRYASLARLMHTIRRLGPSRYQIDLSGPASVLQETRRYGVNFSRFIPALLACKQWSMRAQVHTPWGTPARLSLSAEDGLVSHLPTPEEFDSAVEEAFARDFGPEREGWRLHREEIVLHQGQMTFVPDFVLRHVDGREALLEIVGFWTPEYLARKRQTLRHFAPRQIVLAVAAGLVREDATIGQGAVIYKRRLDPKAILRALRIVHN